MISDSDLQIQNYKNEVQLKLKLYINYGELHCDSVNSSLVFSGAPNVNFREISVRKTIWDLEFSEHFFFLISCLPASPRIFEHLKNGIIVHF